MSRIKRAKRGPGKFENLDLRDAMASSFGPRAICARKWCQFWPLCNLREETFCSGRYRNAKLVTILYLSRRKTIDKDREYQPTTIVCISLYSYIYGKSFECKRFEPCRCSRRRQSEIVQWPSAEAALLGSIVCPLLRNG